MSDLIPHIHHIVVVILEHINVILVYKKILSKKWIYITRKQSTLPWLVQNRFINRAIRKPNQIENLIKSVIVKLCFRISNLLDYVFESFAIRLRYLYSK